VAQKSIAFGIDGLLHCSQYFGIVEFFMTYVDAFLNRDKNTVDVVERVNGRRVYNSYPSRYVTYFPSVKGKYTSIFGDKLDKYETTKHEDFQRELRMLPKDRQFESDINPIFRCFYDNYKDSPIPKLHVAFFDLEVDWHKDRGFSSTEEAFNPITAVSVFCDWLDTNFTLVIKPKTYTWEQATEICDKFDNTVLCEDEAQLIDVFLTLIEDADILTGWNSEGYDIPYLHNRIVQVLSKEHTKRLCLWNRFPRKREYESYGKPTVTYDLVGRVHLDYLQLYRKHTYHEMHSYRLDFVGEYEVGEKKVAYEGSLDKLYNEDFEKFIAYNRQDVMLLVKIDRKLQFIELCNALAHENGVLLATTMGSVLLIDNAITNEAHNLGLIVPIRTRDHQPDTTDDHEDEDSEPRGIVGAYVADPVQGMHEWIGGVDINSLYPSTIRSLNMSKETVVGQIRSTSTDRLINHRIHKEKRSFADSWNEMFGTLEYNQVLNRELVMLTVDFEDGTTAELSGDELYQWVFENPKRQLTISANGTIFDVSKDGVVPGLLARWYKERKEIQAEAKKYAKMADEETDDAKKAEYKELAEFYDRRQLIKKILLNSLYGAVGNSASLYFDNRIAQSTTLTGRCIVKHMGSKINEVISGNYHHKGDAVVYGDTDSVAADSIVRTSIGDKAIEDLFMAGDVFWQEGDKEYSQNKHIKVVSYDHQKETVTQSPYLYVYRHKVKKKKYRITTANGKSVVVTEDHSIMVLQDGMLVEKKPAELTKHDVIVTSRRGKPGC
jgi:DNA polymerase elongation subunit (family B)